MPIRSNWLFGISIYGMVSFGLGDLSHANSTVLPITMPQQPDSTGLGKSQFPWCTIQESMDALEDCRTSLEAYRSDVLEEYNDDVQTYIAALKSADTSLRSLRSSGQITQQAFDGEHEQIANELADASDLHGTYLRPYRERMNDYSDDINCVIKAEEHCRVTLSCHTA